MHLTWGHTVMTRRWTWALVAAIVGIQTPEARPADETTRPAAGGEAWQVGYAESDITPKPRQCQMAGFGRERYAEGTLAPLITQAVALRDGGGRTAVLITADLVGFDRTMVEAIRHRIARKRKLPAAAVMLTASHTHWGPATRIHAHLSCGAPNVWYLSKLESAILDNVNRALASLSPATIEYGHVDFREIGCCRRLPQKGRVRWSPNPAGSFDGHTPILRVTRHASPRGLVVVGHACHPTSSGAIQKWSPDYPGAMRAWIDQHLPDTRSVFVQGCGGDAKIVYKDPKRGRLVFASNPKRAEEAGRKLARAVIAHLETGRLTPLTGSLVCSLASGELSYGKRWSMEEIRRVAYDGSTRSWSTWNARQHLANPNENKAYRYDVQVWQLGAELTVFGMEGEVCSPWGPVLREMAPTPHAMVVGYANNTTAYIPDAAMVREGGYEVVDAHMYFKPAPFTERIDEEVKAIVGKALAALR